MTQHCRPLFVPISHTIGMPYPSVDRVGTASGSASSNRERRNEAVENASKRKKTEAKESKLDLVTIKEINRYVNESSDDIVECSGSDDSEGSEGSEKSSVNRDNDPLSLLFYSRYIFVERYELRTLMNEVGSFLAKILVRSMKDAYREFKKICVDQDLKKRFKQSCFGHLRNMSQHLKFSGQMNVHPYIITTVHKIKIDYMVMFKPYTDKVKNNFLNGLKKNLQGVIVLTLNGDSNDDGYLGGNPIGVCIGDDAYLSTSKVIADTSIDRDLHKCVAMIKKTVLDIVAYIKERRLEKKEKNEQQPK
ncbi:hypothetical protein FXO37_15629 [Capsicum annuum]|nr:hypothetical protein FXO37_15629 [Capsicum annuum]